MIRRMLMIALLCSGPLTACVAAQEEGRSSGRVAVTDRPAVPTGDAPYHAGGNEPFWSVKVVRRDLLLSRLNSEKLALTVSGVERSEVGAITVTAGGRQVPSGVRLIRRPVLCHDSMTGMPHPETVRLILGETVLTGCGGDPRDLLAGPDWQVHQINGQDMIETAQISLTFDPDGTTSGNGSCNRFRGRYDLTGEGLSFGRIATTRMACPAAAMKREGRVLEALKAVTRFDIDATGALLLLDGGKARIVARSAD